ncbi:MAG: hypothetical protein AB7G80_03160 [Dongiaceae bacterium]
MSQNTSVLITVKRGGCDFTLDEFKRAFGLERQDIIDPRQGLILISMPNNPKYTIQVRLGAMDKLKSRDGWEIKGPFENGLVIDAGPSSRSRFSGLNQWLVSKWLSRILAMAR